MHSFPACIVKLANIMHLFLLLSCLTGPYSLSGPALIALSCG